MVPAAFSCVASSAAVSGPPPTIRPSTLFARLCRMLSLVLTLKPATMGLRWF